MVEGGIPAITIPYHNGSMKVPKLTLGHIFTLEDTDTTPEAQATEERKLMINLAKMGIGPYAFLNFLDRVHYRDYIEKFVPEFESRAFNFACDTMGLEKMHQFLMTGRLPVGPYIMTTDMEVLKGTKRFDCQSMMHDGRETYPYFDHIANLFLRLRDDKEVDNIGLRDLLKKEAARQDPTWRKQEDQWGRRGRFRRRVGRRRRPADPNAKRWDWDKVPVKLTGSFRIDNIPDKRALTIIKNYYLSKHYSSSGQMKGGFYLSYSGAKEATPKTVRVHRAMRLSQFYNSIWEGGDLDENTMRFLNYMASRHKSNSRYRLTLRPQAFLTGAHDEGQLETYLDGPVDIIGAVKFLKWAMTIKAKDTPKLAQVLRFYGATDIDPFVFNEKHDPSADAEQHG